MPKLSAAPVVVGDHFVEAINLDAVVVVGGSLRSIHTDLFRHAVAQLRGRGDIC